MKVPARRWGIAVLIIGVIGQTFALHELSKNRTAFAEQDARPLLMPGPFARIGALEFGVLTADLLFLRTITYVAENRFEGETRQVDWAWVAAALDQVTDLDPYFLDPYYYGQAMLTWDGNRIAEANRLLEKGRRYLTTEWLFPFFLGFNHFYFLQDYRRAADYLMEASRLPGSYSFLPTLAARLAVQGGGTEAAIDFLRDTASITQDPDIRKRIEIRLAAFQGVFAIERAVQGYREQHGRPPRDLQQLVAGGFLSAVPIDPYGGRFYIDADGRVKTTSQFVPCQSVRRLECGS